MITEGEEYRLLSSFDLKDWTKEQIGQLMLFYKPEKTKYIEGDEEWTGFNFKCFD